MIRGTSLAILALLALVVLATGSVFAGPRQQAMDDATLSSLSLSVGELTPAFASGTTIYTATVAHDVEETMVTATPTNSNATVEVYIGRTEYSDGVVPLRLGGDTTIEVAVMSQDTTTEDSYTIIVTRPLYIATRSINPQLWLRAALWQ